MKLWIKNNSITDWHLERLINYGSGKEKTNREMLEKYLPKLCIPDERRAFLELLLWNKKF